MVTNLQHKMTRTTTDEKKERTPNSGLAKVGQTEVIEHLEFY
jgi:hypothetical protein